MKEKYQYITTLMLACTCLLLTSCSSQDNTHQPKLVTVESHTATGSLFFSGIIQPLKTVVVTSPVEGTIIDIPFHYGDLVKTSQPIFTIASTKFQADYKAALMQYVKAKNEFNTSQSQLQEAEFLHKNQLISDDEFKMKQSNFYSAQLALIQNKDALASLLKQLNVKNVNLYALTIADIDKITQALHLQADAENLHIFAPADGIALLPAKSEEEHKKWRKGDAVKPGDVLTIIGDLHGLMIGIKVNELTVNKLHSGQKIKVTGIAFHDYSLEGEITAIDKQGESTGGAVPTFAVEITVPRLTTEQQNNIHVGMSAKVEITPDETPHLSVPITAVTEKNGIAYVKKWNEKMKKSVETPIKVGQTTEDAVIVLANLQAGDKVVAPY
ncbi:MAG: hypothetical protein A3E83_00170 [Gammaproteobacteria bacterium RIFCSPHIGHO2_12_FULL_41_20]|nr:MAG: hypothetical protein A3E83_00170 [Gammaproteobacteria bacterium RIFCSPHIGHO2_12_FULL_41_20]